MIRLSSVALMVLVLLPASRAGAEGWELTAVAGGTVGGSFSGVVQNEGENPVEQDPGLKNGFNWGIIGGASVTENIMLELIYGQQNTKFEFTDENDARLEEGLKVRYLHAGALFQSGRSYDKVRGFGGVSLGATGFDPDGGDATQRFSFGFSGGAKVRTHTKSAFRFQAKFYSTYINSNDQLFCDFTCFNTTAKNFVNQWEFSAGFTLLL